MLPHLAELRNLTDNSLPMISRLVILKGEIE